VRGGANEWLERAWKLGYILNGKEQRGRGVSAFERTPKVPRPSLRSPERKITHDKSRLLKATLLHEKLLMPD
jgi:hypothetical protein